MLVFFPPLGGCFCAFGGVFLCFWGVFLCFWGVFVLFSRVSAIFLFSFLSEGPPHRNGEFPLRCPGDGPKTTRDDRSALGRFAVRVHPRTAAKPPKKTIRNTTNTKHHEAHWTGFEPKTKTKRETRKTKQEQEHQNSDPGVEPKTTRDDRSAFGRFAVRVHPRIDSAAAKKTIKNTTNTKHHEAHWAEFEPKTQDD